MGTLNCLLWLSPLPAVIADVVAIAVDVAGAVDVAVAVAVAVAVVAADVVVLILIPDIVRCY